MPRSVTEPVVAPSEPAGASSARKRRGSLAGPVEAAVREDVEQLGDLVGVEPSLSEMAYRLAREIDDGGEEGRQLPQLNRELRATLAALLEGRAAEDDDDDLGDLGSPE